jgi:hypothetical protein
MSVIVVILSFLGSVLLLHPVYIFKKVEKKSKEEVVCFPRKEIKNSFLLGLSLLFLAGLINKFFLVG